MLIGLLALVNGRSFSENETLQILSEFLEAYPRLAALGAPFDGENTTYGQSSQYKRMAAITTDVQFVEAWTEYLDVFSKRVPTWGVLYETDMPIPENRSAYGATHGSDLLYYFPSLLTGLDPREFGRGKLVQRIQDAIINFATDLDPNGSDAGTQWPLFAEDRKVAAIDADAQDGKIVNLPYRSGFDVVRRWFRPDGF